MYNLSYDTFNKINLFFATNSNFSWKKFLEKWREVIFSFYKLPSLELRNARRSVITSYPSDINDWTEQASRKANGPRFLRQLLARGRFIRRRRKYGCIGRYIKCTRTYVDKERTHLQTIGVNAPFSFTNWGGSAGGASEARAEMHKYPAAADHRAYASRIYDHRAVRIHQRSLERRRRTCGRN